MKFSTLSNFRLLHELGTTRTWLDTHLTGHDHDLWCPCPDRAKTISRTRWRLMSLLAEWCARNGEPDGSAPWEVVDALSLLVDPDHVQLVTDAHFMLLIHRLSDLGPCPGCLPAGCADRATATFILTRLGVGS